MDYESHLFHKFIKLKNIKKNGRMNQYEYVMVCIYSARGAALVGGVALLE